MSDCQAGNHGVGDMTRQPAAGQGNPAPGSVHPAAQRGFPQRPSWSGPGEERAQGLGPASLQHAGSPRGCTAPIALIAITLR